VALRISVKGSDALKDMIWSLNQADREVQKQIRVQTKANLTRPWKDEIDRRAHTKLEQRVISDTATVVVSNQNIRIQSAAKGRKLKGGLQPKVHYRAVEFGSGHQQRTYTRKGYKVTRNTTAQFKPRTKEGYVFYPAAKEMIPRLASLWVQTVVKTYADIFDGKS
jgi:hypothetical protein